MILHDLSRVGFRERAAEDGEVLREDEYQPAFDAAIAGDEAVAKDDLVFHAEVGAAVRNQLIGLFKGAFIEQEIDALTGRHLALFVLASTALFTAARFRQRVTTLQFGQFLFEVHKGGLYRGGAGTAHEVAVTGACDLVGLLRAGG